LKVVRGRNSQLQSFCSPPPSLHAGWVKGEFTSGGKPVNEFSLCAKRRAGAASGVVMLHGASQRKDSGNAEYEKMCGELADLG